MEQGLGFQKSLASSAAVPASIFYPILHKQCMNFEAELLIFCVLLSST